MPSSETFFKRGEDHQNAILTDEKVMYIRRSGLGLNEMSAMFGVCCIEREQAEAGGIFRVAAMRGEVVRSFLLRIFDARREQSVGDGLSVHVCKAICVKIVDQRLLKGFHQHGERTGVDLDGQCGLDPVSDGTRQFG